MGQISLYDKFFHSPNWDLDHREGSLDKFRSILKSGRILSPEKSGVKSCWDCEHDKVYLGVHPKGDFREVFAKGYYPDGYRMATQGFYFILNGQLYKDYDVRPGTCKFECTVPDEIDLYKYLVGIGNAGFSIDDKFTVCYYLIKYFNGEIFIPELINIIKERDFRDELSDAVAGYINYCFTPCYNTINKMLASGIKGLIDVGNYHDIVRILGEEGKKIELYDNYGYPLDPKKNMVDVENMIAYVESNKETTYEEQFVKCMRQLHNSVCEEKY